MKKKLDKEKLFMSVLVVALVGIFVGLFSYGLSSVLAMEGSFPPNVLVDGVVPAPSNKQEALELLNNTVDGAVEQKPKLDNERHFDLNADTVEVLGSDELKTMIKYAASDFDAQLDSNFDSVSTDFGQDITDKINIPEITPENITDFDCEYVYYSCSSCGNESDEQLENCDSCGSVYEYNMKYRDEYTVTLNVAVNEETLKGSFSQRNENEAIALCGDTLNESAEINNLNVEYAELKIVFKVDRLTNSLKSLEYSKLMNVDADVKMIGKYEKIGDFSVSFEITEYDRYSFTWAGISLSESEVVIEPNGTGNVLATLTCTDPVSATVSWKSSDESIVTVDNKGYFDAGEKTGEAKIIASFEFNGQTYTDECVVKVQYSVESSKMKDKNIELAVGESEQLNVTVLPKKSTVKTVKWYSENENIATVDESGLLKAVGTGVVTVYSLTDDGYFKSSCEVTVK